MNCLTVALYIRFRLWLKGKKAKVVILKWKWREFPHFAVQVGKRALHYKAHNNNLPLCRQLHFSGYIAREWLEKAKL